ncbi:MAG TPA: hypothetical protein VMR43_07050 [Variovorax sp.]|nr:hypothetical protein [Variovorax sp.]
MPPMSRSAPSSLQLIPPGGGGVLDYAAKLADDLQAPVMELTETTDVSGWSGDLLLLHYSSYGYQKRGIPTWLAERIRTLRQRFRVFGVVFHETYAFGPPWRSAFWLSPMQQRIARDVLREADFWHTNREAAAQWLRKSSRAPVAPHRVLPVFSNIGEPPPVEREREPSLIVFGATSSRERTYAWNDGEIHRFAQQHGLRIHDIGRPLPDGPMARRLAESGAVVHGMLSEAEVSRAMLAARFGVVRYEPIYACKSGIFAAYAAHGMCPILLWHDYDTHDGLQAGVNYADGFDAFPKTGEGDLSAHAARIGRAARQWYEPHRVDAHVDALKKLHAEARP